MKYFSLVGSYDGAILKNNRWIRVKNLNQIDKTEWKRHQGPATLAIARAIGRPIAIEAAVLFSDLKIYDSAPIL